MQHTVKPLIKCISVAAFGMMALVATPKYAEAIVVGYSLTISRSLSGAPFNTPDFVLTNTSNTAGALLTGFSFTIGETDRHFDMVRKDHTAAGTGVDPDPPTGGTLTVSGVDSVNDGLRADLFSIAFTSFDPSEAVSWNVDIDEDSIGDSPTDAFDSIFFNNAGLLNSVVTVDFLFGNEVTTLTLELPDDPASRNSYTFSQSIDIEEVPEPTALALFGVGLIGLSVVRRRRRAV